MATPSDLEKASELDKGWLDLIDFLSDWHWEQDAQFRFTMMTGKRMRADKVDTAPLLGKTRWDQDRIWDVDDPIWVEHKATLAAHQPFSNFIYKIAARNGELRYISTSGQPVFDAQGRFCGYRGISNDVTRQVRADQRRTIEHGVTRVLAETRNLAEGAPQIIQVICETLSWNGGSYWQCRNRDNSLLCRYSWGSDDAARRFLTAAQAWESLPRDSGDLAVQAWNSGESVWVHDISGQPDSPRALEAARSGLHSAFALPIKENETVVAVLDFFSHHIHQPDQDFLECCRFIAGQIGQYCQLASSQRKLRESEARFRSLTELSSDWIWEQDADFRYTSVYGDPDYGMRSRIDLSKRIGKTRWETPALNMTVEDWEAHLGQLERHEPFRDLVLRRPDIDGKQYWVSVSGMPVFDEDGLFIGYRGLGKDITEAKLAEQRIQHLATHDTLTGLPNRALFSEILNRTIELSKRHDRKFAVMFVDLDRFKTINDSLGHDAGDILLKATAERLQHCMRSSDVVARLGGDEFVVLVPEIEQRADVEMVANKILACIFKPVELLGQEWRITGSLGICMFPDDAVDEQGLMKHADAAMYQAKQEGKNKARFYSSSIRSHSLERMALESSLRHAVERNQFFLEYQARLDLKSGGIHGVEALLRWQHPELGVVPPLQFIPLAEETGLIVPIGRWVLKTACFQIMAWRRAGFGDICVGINLSERQFADEFLPADIAAALEASGMPPHLLELELSETMVIQNPARAGRVLGAIKKMGVRLAIDDFGTGYSSLAQLKNFPIDTLKVDRSFIRDVSSNPDDQAMTKAIIAMGKSLGLTVVAEGVETQDQQTFLAAHACDETQGYFFSKPTEAHGLEELLREYSRRR